MKNTSLRARDDESWIYQRRQIPAGAYRDRDSVLRQAEKLSHTNRHIGALNTGTYDITTGKAPEIKPGHGLLSIKVIGDRSMPVMAIDGTPISVGEGTVHLHLPGGKYQVEGASTFTTDPVVVTIIDGETEKITFRDGWQRTLPYLGHYLKPNFTPNFAHMALAMLVLGLLCAAPLGGVGYFSYDDHHQGPLLMWGAVGFLTVSLLFLAFATVFHWLMRPKIEQKKHDMAEPMHPYPWGEPSTVASPILVGAQRLTLPPSDPTTGAMLLMFINERHLFGLGPGTHMRAEDLASIWHHPPRLWIDGIEQPASWGTWWYPLTPGKHTLEVEINGEPSYSMQSTKNEGETTKSRRDSVFIERRKVSAKIVDSHTYVVKRNYQESALLQPRLWIEDPSWSNPLRDFADQYNAT